MKKVYYKLLKKYAWHCNKCMSLYQDNLQHNLRAKDPYLLELFSGSKTVSNCAAQLGFKTFTIDLEKKFQPDMAADISQLKINHIPDRNKIMIIWASVPCTYYSILNILNHWEKLIYSSRKYYYVPKSSAAKQATKLLEKTLHIIHTINPVYYFIENPRGALRHMPQISSIPFMHSVSYNDYGLDVYKPTDIFTNCPFLKLKELTTSVGKSFPGQITEMNGSYQRSIVPAELIKSILTQIQQHHNLITS